MKRSYLIILLLLLLLLLFPLAQFDARVYYLQLTIFLFFSIVLAQSYDMVGGMMGYINLGHITFYAVGAYGFGILYKAGLGFVGSMVLAQIMVIAFAGLISYPFFRLRGAYFSLTTFGLVQLMEYFTNNYPISVLTGGSSGLKIDAADRTLPVYYLSLAVVVGVLLCSWALRRSRLGLAMKTIREDEEVAQDFGVPTYTVKAQALMISSIFPGMVGGLYTWYINYIISDDIFGLAGALTPIAMAMLGGTGLLIGPVVGATFLYTAEELIWDNLARLPKLMDDPPAFLAGVLEALAEMPSAMVGLAIVLVGLFMPGGLVRLRPVMWVLDRIGLLEEDK